MKRADLSVEELRDLARWPDDGDAKDYMRKLLAAVLPRRGRITLESSVVIYEDKSGRQQGGKRRRTAYECLIRATARNIVTELKAGGLTPEDARFNAELFAIRKLLFGNQDVPVLGRLLVKNPISVELDISADDRGGVLEKFHLILRNHGDLRWARPLERKLEKSVYSMKVGWFKGKPGQRSPYLEVLDLAPAIKKLVEPRMYTGSTILLHRLIAALNGQYVNDIEAYDQAARAWFDPDWPDRGERLDAHHVNGQGGDNRQSNILPTGNAEHALFHDSFLRNYNDLVDGVEYRADKQKVTGIFRPPPRVIASEDHFDLVERQEVARAWENLSSQADHVPPGMLLDEDWIPSGLPHELRLARPLGSHELKVLAPRSDQRRNVMRVIAALVEVGGQGSFDHVKCARSIPVEMREKRRTLHNALRSLEKWNIISKSWMGRGHAAHYRIIRPITKTLFKELTRLSTQRRRHTSS